MVRIDIRDSIFIHNRVRHLNSQFRADAAGLSVAYNYTEPLAIAPVLILQGCHFEDNIGTIPFQARSQQIDLVLNQHIFPARGGALGLVLNEYYNNITAHITDCTFYKNHADVFGGGFYIGLDGLNTNHSIIIKRCQFTKNDCANGAGGAVNVGLFNSDTSLFPSQIEFSDSTFDGNTADSSGAIIVLQTNLRGAGNIVNLTRCSFTGNVAYSEGSAVVFAALFGVQSQQTSHASTVTDW